VEGSSYEFFEWMNGAKGLTTSGAVITEEIINGDGDDNIDWKENLR